MKKLLIMILVLAMCLGVVGCGKKPQEPDTDTEVETTDTDTDAVEKPEPNKRVAIPCSFDTTTYDIAELIGGKDHQISKDGKKLESATVVLDVGTNVFDIVYTVSGIERTCEVRIARREGHRVVFNTNGGSFIDTQYVADGATVSGVVNPTRDRYRFDGWYNEQGEKVDLASTPIVKDTTFIARWFGPNEFEMPSKTPITYTTSSAALNINWKDYANAFALRPDEVYCTLKNTATNETYTVMVGKKYAMFADAAPAGASISQGAGNWTVKITGLTGDYTFTQNDLENDNYTTVQSGTSVINTLKNYEPMYDDSSRLMTENGRFYDIAGNVVVLKGLVPWNVGNNDDLAKSTGTTSLSRIQEEGCNVIRITVGLGATAGYHVVDQETKNMYVSKMQGAIDRATALGMYCIVDWGVMNQKEMDNNAYLQGLLEPAKEFFGIMATKYVDNPYVIFELANEPTAKWEVLKPWEETLIRHIRTIDKNAVIIAAPTNHSRHITTDKAAEGTDHIDDPISTDVGYNIAYTFHCYAYTTTYNADYDAKYRADAVYGWRMSDAIKNGLTMVITEFSPANASMTYTGGYDAYGLDADYMEANKWLNFMLENDVNYTLFRFGDFPGGANNIPAQFMFLKGNEKYANAGTWTYDMLSESGKWYYDNVLNATGFIKAADFDYRYDYASATPVTPAT